MSADRVTPSPAPQGWTPARKSWLTWAVIGVAIVAVLLLILSAWQLPPFGMGQETTDNAYVRGRTTVIAPQVNGYVVDVSVKDYEQVKAGQVLAKIDDRIYAAKVEAAKANLEAQVAALGNAKAQLLRAQADMRRVTDLVSDGSVSIRERDQTLAALRQAEAQIGTSGASSDVSATKGGAEAQVDAAKAQLRLAEIDLENTTVTAPEDGQLGEIGVRLGQYVSNGVQLMQLVPDERWVIANFKENQTAGMKMGQKASFTVDALNDARFTGHIERISPAAGSEFSILKPDNATGNFVKVPQRIGVRITVDPSQTQVERLRPGMSVNVQVKIAE